MRTGLPPAELLDKLRRWEPWRHEILFSNGVRTSQLKTTQPYTAAPLLKLQTLARHLPMEALRGGRALDIGCNAGYNSIHLAQAYGMSVTGVDVVKRHIEVSTFLGSLLTSSQVEFVHEDVTFFRRPMQFDLALHFGTLYHLSNPLLSLENTAASLKPGGCLGLETTCYDGSDPMLCKWVKGVSNDHTNRWALSKAVLRDVLAMYGFTGFRVLAENRVNPALTDVRGLTRVICFARKS
ncbi:MAG: methyltransferase domain-containing protein [Gammaproteobacteria bacterium]|nr:methyltransferase domain-containing protein [Gammaproteobacteria bacterium]